MRFVLIDRILELTPGESLVGVKNLTLAEEYLADHFPGFPVMPGVLMLEALTQAGAWLIRETEDFANSVIADIAHPAAQSASDQVPNPVALQFSIAASR